MSQDAIIMDSLKARLGTILIANGYQSDVGQKVHVWRSSPLGPADVPAIMADDTTIDHNNGAVIGMTRNAMTVDIVIVLTGESSLADARNARADLKKCLHGFENMGGLVNSLNITNTSIEMKQFENLIAGAKARLLIEYDTRRNEI